MNQKLSVIIPIYNVEPYLRQCLDSVVNQTYRNLEIILIDDGSPDHCGAICDEYAAIDDRITVIHKSNGGLCAARNDGIRRATGEWLTFVDSDDWCELDYYQGLFNALGDNSADVVCAGGHFREENGKSTIVPSSVDWTKDGGCIVPKQLLPDVLCLRTSLDRRKGASLGLPWDKLYRTAFLRDQQLTYDESLKSWEDLLFNFQVFHKAEVILGCDCIGYHYRQVSTSIAHAFNPNKPTFNYKFVSKLYDYIEQHDMGKNEDVLAAAAAVTMSTIKNSLDCYYYHPNNHAPCVQVRKEIREMINWPLNHSVLHGNFNRYLTPKRVVLKYILRNIRGGYSKPSIWREKYFADFSMPFSVTLI